MGLKFSIPYQIPFYETDITHQVKLPHLLAFSLQVSAMQSESLGNADDAVFDQYGLVWIVTDYAIEIDRLPRYNEKVTITTEAISYNKIFCYRNFYITDEAGQQIMLFKTTFALMDYETRKVVEVPDEVVAPYGAEKTKKLLRGPRYKALENPDETLYRVRYFDLDMDGHVNNSKYLEWMFEVMGARFLKDHIPQKITLKYVKEVRPGGMITSSYELDGLHSCHQVTSQGVVNAQAKITWQRID